VIFKMIRKFLNLRKLIIREKIKISKYDSIFNLF
jgi:hypothetical protein